MWYSHFIKKKTCYSRFYSQMISCMHPYKSPFSFKSFHSFICIWKETNCMQIFLFCFSACSKSLLCIKIVNHILLRFCVLVIYFEYLFIFLFYLQLLQSCFIVLYIFLCLYYEQRYDSQKKTLKNIYKNRRRIYTS